MSKHETAPADKTIAAETGQSPLIRARDIPGGPGCTPGEAQAEGP